VVDRLTSVIRCVQIYDVSHNIAKVVEHMVEGKQKRLLVRGTHWAAEWLMHHWGHMLTTLTHGVV
jgi:RNA-splicing ligase RtcB